MQRSAYHCPSPQHLGHCRDFKPVSTPQYSHFPKGGTRARQNAASQPMMRVTIVAA